jgi:hypothetical protein
LQDAIDRLKYSALTRGTTAEFDLTWDFEMARDSLLREMKSLTGLTEERLKEFANVFERQRPELEAQYDAYAKAGLKPPKAIADALSNGALITAIANGFDQLDQTTQAKIKQLAESGELTVDVFQQVLLKAATGISTDTSLMTAWSNKVDELVPALEGSMPGLEAALTNLGVNLSETAGAAIPQSVIDGVVMGFAAGTVNAEQAARMLADSIITVADQIPAAQQEVTGQLRQEAEAQAAIAEAQVAIAEDKEKRVLAAENSLISQLQAAIDQYRQVALEGIKALTGESEVTMADFMGNMQKNQQLLTSWEADMQMIADRTGNVDFLAWLRDLGPEQAQLIDQIANSSGGDFAKLETLWTDGVEKANQSATAAIQSSADALAAQGSVWAGGLSIALASAFSQAGANVDAHKAGLLAAFDALGVDAGTVLGAKVPQGVADVIAQGLLDGTLTVEQAAQRLVEASKTSEHNAQVQADNKTTGDAAAAGVEAGETEGVPPVTTATQALADAATISPEQAETMRSANETAATASASALSAAIETEGVNITAASRTVATSAVDAFKAIMTTEQGATIGSAFVNAITTAVTTAQTALVAAIQAAATAVLTTAQMILSSAAGGAIGQAFGQGLANGISAMTPVIAKAARAAASAALAAAKSELGIQSPSKAMTEVGRMYDAGFVGGIDGGLRDIRAAAMINPAAQTVSVQSRAAEASSAATAAGAVQIGDVNITTESVETDQDWRSIGQILGEEVARRNRYRGVVTI